MNALGCLFCPSNIALRSKQTDEDKKVTLDKEERGGDASV